MTELRPVIIPGAQKSGTTSVYNSLAKHPLIQIPEIGARKEPQFFAHGDDTVREHFEWYRGAMRLDDEGMSLDASTAYLPTPSAPSRIYEFLPDARIIILLRDPAKRTFSAYKHKRQSVPPKETRDFETILDMLSGIEDLEALFRRENELTRNAALDEKIDGKAAADWHREKVCAPFPPQPGGSSVGISLLPE